MTSSMCKQWDSGCTYTYLSARGCRFQSAEEAAGASAASNILETPPATRQLPARSKAFVDRTLPADRRTRFCGPPPEAGPWFINGPQPEAGPWFINRDNIEDRYLDNIKWPADKQVIVDGVEYTCVYDDDKAEGKTEWVVYPPVDEMNIAWLFPDGTIDWDDDFDEIRAHRQRVKKLNGGDSD